MASRDPAYRRYLRRSVVITAAYLGSVALASSIIPDDAPADALTIGLAALTGLPVIGWLWAMGRLLIELRDEYLRMLEVRKMIVATGFTLAITSMWGMLELFSPDVPRLAVFYVFPLWCGSLAIGQIFNRFTIGDGDSAS